MDRQKRWRVFWHGSVLDDLGRVEVFESPDGHWYIRCPNSEEADLVVPVKTRGLEPVRLKSIDHWRPQGEVAPCAL